MLNTWPFLITWQILIAQFHWRHSVLSHHRYVSSKPRISLLSRIPHFLSLSLCDFIFFFLVFVSSRSIAFWFNEWLKMLEDQVASLLQRYLGDYVIGLNKEALKISVWQGLILLFYSLLLNSILKFWCCVKIWWLHFSLFAVILMRWSGIHKNFFLMRL